MLKPINASGGNHSHKCKASEKARRNKSQLTYILSHVFCAQNSNKKICQTNLIHVLFLFLCSCQIELEYHPSASDLYLLASFYIRNICLLIMTPRETRSFVLRSLPPPPLLYINARPWPDSLLLNATHPERTGRTTQTGAECRSRRGGRNALCKQPEKSNTDDCLPRSIMLYSPPSSLLSERTRASLDFVCGRTCLVLAP